MRQPAVQKEVRAALVRPGSPLAPLRPREIAVEAERDGWRVERAERQSAARSEGSRSRRGTEAGALGWPAMKSVRLASRAADRGVCRVATARSRSALRAARRPGNSARGRGLCAAHSWGRQMLFLRVATLHFLREVRAMPGNVRRATGTDHWFTASEAPAPTKRFKREDLSPALEYPCPARDAPGATWRRIHALKGVFRFRVCTGVRNDCVATPSGVVGRPNPGARE